MYMRRINYPGFTLIEILVVMSVMIILGGFGLFAFGGLRDTVVINQNIADLKQDIQQIQQDAMLIQKSPDEGWVYGIGIDFTNFPVDGTYTFFKWCSPFDDFGNIKTKSEIPAYDPSQDILLATRNGFLPETLLTNCSGSGQEGLAPYTRYVDGKITAGFDLNIGAAKYVVFESSTGRAFLYDQDGKPVNYTEQGVFVTNLDGEIDTLALFVKRNQGKIHEAIEIMPISGEVMRGEGTLIETAELSDPDPYDPPSVTTPEPALIDVGGNVITPSNPRDIEIDGGVIHLEPPVTSVSM